MSVFFNGRLWTSPATMSAVDDSAMANQNLSVGNVVALIGQSSGGQPNTALSFGSPDEAKATLISGDLLTAVLKAFDPSSETDGPSEVIAVRVNPAVQASLSLLDSSSAAAVNLVSTDYGLYTNQIKVKVEPGSTTGLKLTTQFGNDYYLGDNVARNAFSVQYAGGALTATMSITGTSLVLQAPSGNTVATVDLNAFPTVQQVVDKINSYAGFTASVVDGNGASTALNGLDYVTAVDVKTSAYTATANLQAVVDWFNSTGEGFITATRANNAGKVPVAVGFTYLTGGSDGTVTMNEWSNAYTTLQTADVQWVTPISSNPAIWAMNDTHCAFMSNIARKERRGIVGMASGSTDSAALAAAKALNSDRTSLVHLGFYDYDANGNLVLQPPYILAALLAGAFAGVNPGTALTNKAIKVRGLERNLRNPTDTDALINGGVLAVENTSSGYKVVKSITTWLVNDNYNRVEVSCGVAVDFVARNVRQALDVLRGQKGTPIVLSRAVSIADSTLRELARPEPQGPGVIVGDKASPAYRNIKASLEGDVLRVDFECSPVIPVNFIPVTIHAVPYSGSASAAA
jgi:hypothetical protein